MRCLWNYRWGMPRSIPKRWFRVHKLWFSKTFKGRRKEIQHRSWCWSSRVSQRWSVFGAKLLGTFIFRTSSHAQPSKSLTFCRTPRCQNHTGPEVVADPCWSRALMAGWLVLLGVGWLLVSVSSWCWLLCIASPFSPTHLAFLLGMRRLRSSWSSWGPWADCVECFAATKGGVFQSTLTDLVHPGCADLVIPTSWLLNEIDRC